MRSTHSGCSTRAVAANAAKRATATFGRVRFCSSMPAVFASTSSPCSSTSPAMCSSTESWGARTRPARTSLMSAVKRRSRAIRSNRDTTWLAGRPKVSSRRLMRWAQRSISGTPHCRPAHRKDARPKAMAVLS